MKRVLLPPITPALRVGLSVLMFAGLVLGAAAPALAARVVIVQNSTHALYEDAARVIRAKLGDKHELRVVDLTGLNLEEARKRGTAMMETKPDVLVALGDKALYLAEKFMKPTPVIFAMVNNWRALDLDRDRVSGVSMQLDPETMASQIKMFLPNHRRIGVIYGKGSQRYVEKAMLKAARLEQTLIPVFVKEPTEFPAILEAIAPVLDLFWLVEDAQMTTTENVKALMAASSDNKLPTLCHSPGLVTAGLTLSISPDREEVGRQVVTMLDALLSGGITTADLAIAPPAKARVTVNRAELKSHALEIDPMLLGFVTQVDSARERR